jgi:hypothetical protein
MVKVKNKYHKRLSFPKIGVSIGAGEEIEVSEDVAGVLLTNRDIELVHSYKKVEKKKELPKVEEKKEEEPIEESSIFDEEEVDEYLLDNDN